MTETRTREELEAALRDSEERFERAQRVAHLGAWEWDLAKNEVWRSNEFFAIFGLLPDRTRVRPFSFTDYIPKEDVAILERAIDDAVARKGSYVVEHRIRRADGEERCVVQRGDMLVEEGHPPRMVGTILDVTERRRAEIEREAAARRLRAVLDQCPIGIVIFEGKHGERIVPNERAVELLGRSASPGLGAEQSVGYILTAEEGVVAGDDLPGMRALRGERTEAEMLVRTPAGARVPVLVSAGPILGEDGAIQGAVVAFENISSLKELERLRIEWSSIVAHDLRQPLNTIGLVARLLARRLGNDPDDRKSVEQIERATRRLNVMIQDLSDLSQLDIRRVSLSREPVDIGALVRASASRLALEAPDREPRVCVADDLPMIRLDADRIAQVLDNLTSNAVKYGRPDAPIVLDVRASDHEIIVSVTSQGPTIPPDELAHVFDRFHRTRDVRRGRVQGLGLGLYIVRGLVEAHGGRVSAESTPDGLTTFRFALPIGSNEQR